MDSNRVEIEDGHEQHRANSAREESTRDGRESPAARPVGAASAAALLVLISVFPRSNQ